MVGVYHIRREGAGGGMGTVSLAVRTSRLQPFSVAVKTIRRGLHTIANCARFIYVCRIVASLDYPDIARTDSSTGRYLKTPKNSTPEQK